MHHVYVAIGEDAEATMMSVRSTRHSERSRMHCSKKKRSFEVKMFQQDITDGENTHQSNVTKSRREQ